MGLFSKDEKVELKVTGMSCGHCEASVVEALKKLDGVKKASADHEAEKAVISVAKGKLDKAALIAAVQSAGYEAS